jgi:integrase
MYTREGKGWDIAEQAEWRAAQLHAGVLARREGGDPPPPITYAQCRKAREELLHEPLAQLFLDLIWALAARPGDVGGLKKKDIKLSEAAKGDELVKLTATVRVGKGAKFRGPYPVPTTIRPQTAEALSKALNDLEPQARLFPAAAKQKAAVKAAIEKVCPQLKLPSIRKGAARHLAESGMDTAQLGQMLGHTRATTTTIYLGYGEATLDNGAPGVGRAGKPGRPLATARNLPGTSYTTKSTARTTKCCIRRARRIQHYPYTCDLGFKNW